MNAKITALGVYVPPAKFKNDFFEKSIETNDEWIKSRTGIRERYFAEDDVYTSDLSVKAIENLSKYYDKSIADVDFVIIATTTPDQVMPSVASQVLQQLKIENAGAMDISAACAGFTYGIMVAKGLIMAESHRKILVVGAETYSKFLDYSDRATCILFGDGAGAVLIEADEEKGHILLGITGTEGQYGKDLYLSNSSKKLNCEEIIGNNKVHQNGRTVFKWAVQNIPTKILRLLDKNNLSLENIKWLIPHSANLRIIEAICEELNFPKENALESVQKYGNTSAASIPLAWYEGIKNGKIKKGDKMLLIGFGGGLTYAGLIVEQSF